MKACKVSKDTLKWPEMALYVCKYERLEDGQIDSNDDYLCSQHIGTPNTGKARIKQGTSLTTAGTDKPVMLLPCLC